MTVEGLKARAGHGELEAHGTVLTSGDVNLAVEAANLPLEESYSGRPARLRLMGSLGVSGKAGVGRLDAPRPSGTLSIDRFEVMQIPLGSAKASFTTDGRTVTLAGKAGDEVEVPRRPPSWWGMARIMPCWMPAPTAWNAICAPVSTLPFLAH